ncbi:low-specificity L-threonine aldolase [Desulforamulus hydrothermalis]|uniref:L-allo-threonine aldolase n=1 Tax=Desulforamulus hydrothermalis Lam5 = DSM 18033 TaxID=1121428 RepID=K8DZV9_9FIRM|nr:low-specificity L-threonine aldolase [Desulforamulus hydrothermalis]CCO08615.1 L-allo-threonine aldolase [Desulforamulus hydrothermalis Lam5 = DSM 18033]SHH01111.1 L-threonine aldolase [Desulforamulus hydrothermalis Lam5 = DSM 18033]
MKIKIVDLRSDTVTLPTEEMRTAMAGAKVGDDVYGEDPTVKELEATAASLVGKEAALFVPSGTMGNQLAVLTHTERGDEVILDSEAHIYCYEVGAPALLAGVQLRPVSRLLSEQGPSVLRQALRPADLHFPRTSLVCLENTFNRGGGTVLSPRVMAEIYDLARQQGLRVHLDGARIFNAAVALNVDVKVFTCCCDSLMFCLSKGLAAPVGSLLAGSRDFIQRARKYRKALGGGMRQAGVLAAAGLVALKMVDRLAEDHSHARRLAEGMARLPGLKVDLARVQTNIVVAEVPAPGTAAHLVSELHRRGIKCAAFGPGTIRLVTHKDVSAADIDYTLQVMAEILG